MCLWVLSYLRPCLLAAKHQDEQDPDVSETGSIYTLNGYPFVYGHVFLPQQRRAPLVPNLDTFLGDNSLTFNTLVSSEPARQFLN
jgi:hypothetical protein